MEPNCVVITKQLSKKFFFPLHRIQQTNYTLSPFPAPQTFIFRPHILMRRVCHKVVPNMSLENLNKRILYQLYAPQSYFLLLSGDVICPKVEGMFLFGIPSDRHSSDCGAQHCWLHNLDAMWSSADLCTPGFFTLARISLGKLLSIWIQFCTIILNYK